MLGYRSHGLNHCPYGEFVQNICNIFVMNILQKNLLDDILFCLFSFHSVVSGFIFYYKCDADNKYENDLEICEVIFDFLRSIHSIFVRK